MSRYVCLELAGERGSAVEVNGGSIVRGVNFALLPGTLAGGTPTDPARLARQLRAALDASGIAARHVRVALPDSAMLTRILRLPPMPRRDLRRATAYAVERAIPIPPGQLTWTCRQERGPDGNRAIRVVAAWKDALERLRQAVEAAGLRLDAVEPRSAALAALFGGRPTVLLEHTGRDLQATATAAGGDSFTALAPVPEDPAALGRTLESLVVAARRHLGAEGKDVDILVTQELALATPVTLTGDLAAATIARRHKDVRPELAVDAFLAAIGLIDAGRRLTVTGRARPESPARPVLRGTGWIPALAFASIASWSAVAVGAALLLGWHPSWPLAP